MRNIDKIIIHCTATPQGRNVTLADVTRWHKNRGFKTIGYHYLIALDGEILRGRDIAMIGAHCKGQNESSIGIAYVGGCDKDMQPKDTRTKAQIHAMKILIESFKGFKIYGHCDFSNKACPCFDVKNLL